MELIKLIKLSIIENFKETILSFTYHFMVCESLYLTHYEFSKFGLLHSNPTKMHHALCFFFATVQVRLIHLLSSNLKETIFGE